MPMAARAFIMARHNALARDLCAFAKEAGLRAACEQIAVELRPPEDERQGEDAEENTGRATRAADIRIEAEAGKPVTWIDVAAHCDMATCRSNPTPKRADNAGMHGERAKFSQWGIGKPRANPFGGRLIPAVFGTQGRTGQMLGHELQRWAPIYALKHARGTEFSIATVQTAALQRWRQRLSSSLQRGNAAIVRAALGCQHSRGGTLRCSPTRC